LRRTLLRLLPVSLYPEPPRQCNDRIGQQLGPRALQPVGQLAQQSIDALRNGRRQEHRRIIGVRRAAAPRFAEFRWQWLDCSTAE
jgi:hypothetical protein